jgi:hypothetical protein
MTTVMIEYGLRMGDYFAQFLDGELATLSLAQFSSFNAIWLLVAVNREAA